MGGLEKLIEKILSEARTPLSIKDLFDLVSGTSNHKNITLQEIYVSLLKLEKNNLVERVYGEDFDLSDPLMTVKWKFIKYRQEEQTHLQMVASFPPRIGDFKQWCSKYGIRYFMEALEDVINTADRDLRIVCPFIDATLLNVLIKADRIRQGFVKVKILSEQGKNGENVNLLNYMKSVLRSIEVRYADIYESSRKVFGIHAKAVAADEEILLMGSFNLTIRHIATNIDLGVLIKGPLVLKFVKLFDDLWEAVKNI